MLHELLRERATATPDQPLVVATSGTSTYREVADRAASLAAGLAARDIRRFAAQVDDIAELIALLAAASAVGAEACQYGRSIDAATVLALAAAFDHDVLVADHPVDVDGIAVLPIGDLAVDDADPAVLASVPDATPLLMLTTGTTGLPKGARQEWSRLVATHRTRVGAADAVWLLAHLPNQFAGMGVLLHVLASGSTLVVPDAFQPRDAIAAMRDHAVTNISATPTFWRFVTALIDEEDAHRLPLRQITMAGEAVPAPLLQDMHRLFPDARISQIYGATEFGSSVAVGGTTNGLPASVLDRPDDAEVQFRIVDGELQVRSRIGMLGYYGSDDVGDSWRPTGDLVEQRGDRIAFVGRTSETINVGGVKVHPLPVEELVSAIPGVELVHAFGRKSGVTGQIVALDVVASAGADVPAVEAAIRAACAALPAAAQPRRIRFVESLDIRDTKIARGPSDG